MRRDVRESRIRDCESLIATCNDLFDMASSRGENRIASMANDIKAKTLAALEKLRSVKKRKRKGK